MVQRANTASSEPVSGKVVGQSDWRIGTGHPLKKWRKWRKISLEKLAMETEISASSLSRIENYKQTPLIGAAQKIIKYSRNALKPEDFFH